MHWEKIPLSVEEGKVGTRMIKEQLEALCGKASPDRFVRTRVYGTLGLLSFRSS